jgi:N-acetyl-beta-hexosaminidase
MIFTRFKDRTYGSEVFSLPETLTFAQKGVGKAGGDAFAAFCPQAVLTDSDDAAVIFDIDHSLEDKAEIYKITIGEQKITVGSREPRGFVNGAATLALLLREGEVRTGVITDYPDCTFRSFMIDLGRGILPFDELKSIIFHMALAKYNRVHIHLMESYGLCYRSEAMKGLGSKDGEQYSISQMRELARYCQLFSMEIIPEVEIPAHATAVVSLYPSLACDTDTDCHWTVCPGTEELWERYDRLIGEVVDIFPCEYVHIGTDELEMPGAGDGKYLCFWDSCSKCRALREREKLADMREEFYYLVNRMHEIVLSHGKKMMMWNDQVDVSKDVPLPRDILIEFWRVAMPGRGPVEGCSMQGFLEKGFRVINANYPYTYVDLEHYLSVEKMMTWTPTKFPETDTAYHGQIIGGESCAWEVGNFADYPHYGTTLYPAMMLFADKLWDHRDREYTDEDRRAMSLYLFGKPMEQDVFACFGSLLPPRTSRKHTYAERVDGDLVRACIEELSGVEDTPFAWTARKYAERLAAILESDICQ